MDIPVIESVSLSSDKLSDGGAVKVTVRVRSVSRKVLEKTLSGPLVMFIVARRLYSCKMNLVFGFMNGMKSFSIHYLGNIFF